MSASANLFEFPETSANLQTGFAFPEPLTEKYRAAKLILCGNFMEGARRLSAPLATEFLAFRHTAVEMAAVGWLCRKQVTKEWTDRVESHDYAKIMAA